MLNRQNEKGFSVIECLLVILVISSISLISFKSFKGLSEKVKQASKIDDVTLLQYSLCKRINEINDIILISDNGDYFFLSYPVMATTPSISGHEDDDINYDLFCRRFLADAFNAVSGFENGTFEYQPVKFTTCAEIIENDITYKSSKGVVILHCRVKNAATGAYDKLWINGFTYTSNDGVSVTVNL